MPQELYYEDFNIGRKFQSVHCAPISAQEIKEFGEKYDPQPFHLDIEAGANSFFNGLAASGWLTAAIIMRLRVDTIRVAGGMIGAGVDEMRWLTPVRPGDSLRTESEVVSLRASRRRPQYGVVKIASIAYNQRDEVVMRSTINFLAPMRPATQAAPVK
jgi:acyl dehydratase